MHVVAIVQQVIVNASNSELSAQLGICLVCPLFAASVLAAEETSCFLNGTAAYLFKMATAAVQMKVNLQLCLVLYCVQMLAFVVCLTCCFLFTSLPVYSRDKIFAYTVFIILHSLLEKGNPKY